MANLNEFCRSEKKFAKKRFTWTIEYFSLSALNQYGQFMESATFTSISANGQRLEWRLRFYPIGKEYISYGGPFAGIYLINTDGYIGDVRIKFECSIIGNDTKKLESDFRKTHRNDQTFGFSIISNNDLLDVKKGFLPDDSLTIVCDITMLEEKVLASKMPAPAKIHLGGQNEGNANLLATGLLSDCILISADCVEFKVHKCILASQSSVFTTMFQTEMTEKQQGIVKIIDIHSDVLGQMLVFIYTGNLPEKMSQELLGVAHKYLLEKLKGPCEYALANSLNLQNCCELLALANLHSAEYLKSCAIDYIRMNAKKVIGSYKWKMLRQSLVNEVIGAIVANK